MRSVGEKVLKKIIQITCTGASTLPWQEITPFQGELKDLHIKEYEKFREMILELGFSEPISIWKNKNQNFILNGHQRLRVIQNMVEKEGFQCPPLPVNWVEADSLKQAKKKVLSLTSQYGRLTGDGLYEFTQAAGITKEEVGKFRFPEIKFEKWKDEFFEEPEEDDGSDTIPKDVPSICQPGDVWELGEHRLLCGDSALSENIANLMGPELATLVFTDPPYGVSYAQGKFTGSKVKKKFKDIANDDLRGTDLQEFLAKVWNCLPVGDVASIYCWSAPLLEGGAMLSSLVNAGWHMQSQIVWDKKRLILGRADYQWRHEICWYGYRGKNHFWCGDRDQTTIWEQKRDSEYSHPTQKPVELSIRAIQNSSQSGEVVFDPFCGSGSTIIGCEKTGRRGRGIELDPNYCDVIIERFFQFTKKDPVRISDGVKWSKLREPTSK